MKIAILVWDLNVRGGTQRQALELALELQKAGNMVDVYCYVYDQARCYTELCEKLSIFSVTNTLPSRQKRERKIFKKILNIFDIYKNTISSIFIKDQHMNEMRELIEKTHPLAYYDVINVHDYQVYKIARLIKHPRIVWMMNDIQRAPAKSANVIHRKLYNVLQKILARQEIKNIHQIVVLDKRNQSLCKETYGKDAVIIRSGVDLNMFMNIGRERSYNNEIWSIFASSVFFPYRRFEDLVDAAEILIKKNVTNFAVTINGIPDRSYGYYLSIKERVQEKKLEKYVTLVAGMSEEQLKQQYSKSDIFVFPNNNQTWGLVVFEAMLAGCTCIVSRGAGAHEVLTDKENALLVDPLSPHQIAASIETLIKDPREMKRIAENGKHFVQENLSWEKYAQQMLAIFKHEI